MFWFSDRFPFAKCSGPLEKASEYKEKTDIPPRRAACSAPRDLPETCPKPAGRSLAPAHDRPGADENQPRDLPKEARSLPRICPNLPKVARA